MLTENGECTKDEGGSDMSESIYPLSSQDLARKRREFAPII
jgi:hypothetical protein